ncbi:MAG: hypothetical protein CMK74_02165 [Pseudomonadales bacterium]|nr:hypothetical protein [Pseudomonadales bacterium]|tara:strand:- start:432 stop:818 length:387 start_codon:yes stop_codon:yes gene_type:complete
MNDNCLAGMRCPNKDCDSQGPFEILGTATFLVYDDGTEGYDGVDWEDHHPCKCFGCSYSGTVAAFRQLTPEEAARFVQELEHDVLLDRTALLTILRNHVSQQTTTTYLEYFGGQDPLQDDDEETATEA